LEHIAGPGCVLESGYSGHRISLEEIKGCREILALVKKEEGWQVEEDDQELERDEKGKYFLSGIGEGSPDCAPLVPKVVRHGGEPWVYNYVDVSWFFVSSQMNKYVGGTNCFF
jgi:hypothetical protein